MSITETQYSSIVKNLTTIMEIAMKVLIDKFNNQNIPTEESQSDNKEEDQNLIGSKDERTELCPDCHGSGSFQDNTCSSCNGKGII
jgi:DnaJ-class molecular chaperone